MIKQEIYLLNFEYLLHGTEVCLGIIKFGTEMSHITEIVPGRCGMFISGPCVSSSKTKHKEKTNVQTGAFRVHVYFRLHDKLNLEVDKFINCCILLEFVLK